MKKVMFISSTGGHLSEMLQLKELFKKYDYSIVTEKTKSTLYLKKKYKNVNYLIHTTRSHLISYLFKGFINIIKSFILYLRINPDFIVTTGTHTAVPISIIGKLLGSKVIYIESFANIDSPSMTGKILYKKHSNLFIVQWKDMKKFYPDSIYGGSIY